MSKIKVPTLMIVGAVLVGFLLGSILSGQVQAESKSLLNQLRIFSQVLGHVQRNYVEDVESEELVQGAIRGMLEELDPHSTYVDPESFARMNERNTGEYEGIGISFEVRDGWITVISAIEGGPSAGLGIRPGDRIVRIEGETAKGLANDEVVSRLKGAKGTAVHIAVARPGVEREIEYTIVRDKIPIYSVPYSFMMDDGVTGYIRMIRFSATTARELEDALSQLEDAGMERLVLDLRNNSGGFLNQAIEVADKFIDGNEVLVYTKGRIEGSSQYYYSTEAATHAGYPLIVLVNHGSASASEIVSGAVQDHDRGLVAGVTTFGKGLVQRQYMLSDNSALLLTVARYYTPSGRLIQRDYADRDEYLEHWRTQAEETTNAEIDTAGRPVFHTLNEGREVYGGGGVTPDILITTSYDLTDDQIALEQSRTFFEFANEYVSTNLEASAMSEDAFLQGWSLPDEALTAYREFALADTAADLSAEQMETEEEYIRRGIKREIAGNLWGLNSRYRVILSDDPMVAEAISHFPQAELMARLYGEASHQQTR